MLQRDPLLQRIATKKPYKYYRDIGYAGQGKIRAKKVERRVARVDANIYGDGQWDDDKQGFEEGDGQIRYLQVPKR